MKVSIITASYNAEKFIEETIRSVQQQTYSNIEYIIIDGASKDNTINIIDNYKNLVSKLISEPDNGVYEAMNKGIKTATGDLLFFLNAGDIFINELVVESFVSEAQSSKEGLILGDILLLNKYTGELYYEKQPIIDKVKLITSSVFHPSTFFRRETFEKHGLYNEENKIVSDYEWYINYFTNGGDYKYINLPVSIFNLGEGLSSNAENENKHILERIKVQQQYFKNYEINTIELLKKFFPRKIDKVNFRKKLSLINLNTVY